MKAANFDYVRAGSLDEIAELLAEHGPKAKLLAGGQSLVPMLAMRLTKPAMLIDVNEVHELKGIELQEDALVIRGGTRQYQLESSELVLQQCPLIRKALHWVGHPQTRNRGTLGGSLVHADPSAELPLTSLMLDAEIIVQGADGEESLDISEFFLAPLVTALAPDQCIVRVSFPIWHGAVGSSFHEVSPRRGDFAMVSAAAQIALDENGKCVRAAVGLGGVAATPIRVRAVEEALMDGADLAQLRDLALLAADEIDPESDLHASAAYRRDVSYTLIERALRDALLGARASREKTGVTA
jgi:CO/xanthine dehydrogenase FAD-binding subunit